MRRRLTQVRRCKTTAVNDSQPVQTVQVHIRNGVDYDNVEHYQEYGLTSVPDVEQDDVAGLVIEVMGHKFVLGLEEPAARPKGLAPGEVMLYHREGHHIHLLKGGKITIKASEMTVDCPKTTWTGDIEQTGSPWEYRRSGGRGYQSAKPLPILATVAV